MEHNHLHAFAPRPADAQAHVHAARRTQPLETVWARHTDEVRAAQRLRYQVFVDELGACLAPLRGRPAGHDIDLFDDFCEHLLVRTLETDHAPAQVVGTYRVLTPAAARLVGGLYSDAEFDLVRLAPLRPHMAELGRSCVDAGWRTGGVIMLLWSKLMAFMASNGLQTMIGCASVPMRDGGHAATSLWHTLRRNHLAPIGHQVRPRLALPVDDLRGDLPVEAPPLIRGYLKCGAKVLGPPAWDPEFGTADLPMMLDLAALTPLYRRRFLGA